MKEYSRADSYGALTPCAIEEPSKLSLNTLIENEEGQTRCYVQNGEAVSNSHEASISSRKILCYIIKFS